MLEGQQVTFSVRNAPELGLFPLFQKKWPVPFSIVTNQEVYYFP